MEQRTFVVDAGFRLVAFGISAPGAFKASFKVDIDQDGHVGFKAVAGDAVEGENGFGVDASAGSLVDECGIGKAVAEDGGVAVEGRADDFFNVLGAAGEIEEEFGAGADV